MQDFMKPLKSEKFDFLTFLAGEKQDSIELIGTTYAEPGEPVDTGIMGESYHIILFREDKEDKNKYDPNIDCFDAVLVEPLEYVSGMIKNGWFGIIARKTTTSRPLIDRMLDKFQGLV